MRKEKRSKKKMDTIEKPAILTVEGFKQIGKRFERVARIEKHLEIA